MASRFFTAAFLIATAVHGASCAVDLPDEPGLSCDDSHPCSSGRDCIEGICREEGGKGGGSAGGAAGGSAGGSTGGGGASTGGGSGGNTGGGSGGGSAGGGTAPADAGSVLWRQAMHGFSGVSDLGSATITIRADAGNQVVSTVVTADDNNDRGTANQADAGFLPAFGHGRLKGTFRLPATLSLKGRSTFLRLENNSTAIIALTFNTNGSLEVRTDTNVIGPMAYTQTVTWPGGFLANTDYTVDVAWRRGAWRTLFVNGVDAGVITASDPMMNLVVPNQLRLGIYRYDSDAGTGWSVTLDDWAMADGPTVGL